MMKVLLLAHEVPQSESIIIYISHKGVKISGYFFPKSSSIYLFEGESVKSY